MFVFKMFVAITEQLKILLYVESTLLAIDTNFVFMLSNENKKAKRSW